MEIFHSGRLDQGLVYSVGGPPSRRAETVMGARGREVKLRVQLQGQQGQRLRAKRESSIVTEKVYTLFGPIFQMV